MVQGRTQPHVSAALMHLRPLVTVSAAAVVICAFIQFMVFGFAHFTEARWTTPTVSAEAQKDLAVVGSAGDATRHGPIGTSQLRTVSEQEEVSANKVLSRWDPVMGGFWTISSAVGAIAVLLMTAQVFTGMVVAAGGAVPGEDKVVKASTWTLMLLLTALPVQGWLSSVPWPGVFSPYSKMITASELVNAGARSTVGLVATYGVMAILSAGVAIAVAVLFRSGVARGIIVTSVNELDAKLEEEMHELRKRGVASNYGAAHSVGALNQAIGSSATLVHPPAPATRTILDRLAAEADVPRSGGPTEARATDKRPI